MTNSAGRARQLESHERRRLGRYRNRKAKKRSQVALTTSAYDFGRAVEISELAAEERSSAAQVTIGLPVCNGERYIGEAIDSILGQTFRDFVLVVSDNASNDRTVEIVTSYTELDDRV